MNDNELVTASTQAKSRLGLCYVGIIIALGMSTYALLALHGTSLPLLWQQHALPAINPSTKLPVPAQIAPLPTIHALNLVYCAELNLKLGNKKRTEQILQLLPDFLPQELQPQLQALTTQVANYALTDKVKLQQSLNLVKDFYTAQVSSGKFGQKTIAQVVKIQEQGFMHKQDQFLAEIERLENLISAERYAELAPNIDNLIKAATELDISLAEKAQALTEFKENNIVSFDELLMALSN